MKINQYNRASVEFDLTRPLGLSRSGTLADTKLVYIYSTAVDGHNKLRVATVSIANIVGLSDEQEAALVNRIADEIVAPSFSDDEIEDIAFAIFDCEGIHSSITDHHRDRARQVADNITARRRLALSGAR